jgi:hypothetical protein
VAARLPPLDEAEILAEVCSVMSDSLVTSTEQRRPHGVAAVTSSRLEAPTVSHYVESRLTS